MKLAAMLLLPAGWIIVLCAIVLFAQPLPRGGFVFSGVCVELLGLALAFRGQANRGGDEQ